MATSHLLKKNIKATITYYDVLDFPLTTFEVWKMLMNYHEDTVKKFSLFEVSKKLQELATEGHIQTHNGMWFLPWRNSLVDTRIAREKISIAKLKRMRRLVKILRYLPFIRMIAATGSLSFRHATKSSDWDMFIVMKKGHLFTGRMLLTGFLHFIGKRRHGSKVQDRACLNYYSTDESLAMEPQDWYGAHEYQVMVPLFQGLSVDAFVRANGWMMTFRPHTELPMTPHRLTNTTTPYSEKFQKCLEALFSFSYIEEWCKKLQTKKIENNPKTKISGSLIIANDDRLVFFPRPRSPRVFDEFHKRLTF